MRPPYTIREHEPFRINDRLNNKDLELLEAIWRETAVPGKDGAVQPVFARKRGELAAGSHVGILTTNRPTTIEILPKIDLGGPGPESIDDTKAQFLRMLRHYRGLRGAAKLPESSIQSLRRFPMLEIFVRLFLENLHALARRGLARRYRRVAENLPYLRGRLLFREQMRLNIADAARFYVAHDEFSVNRPANRLISSTLHKLASRVQSSENRQSLQQLAATFADVPGARNPHADWQKHHVDRSMAHYNPVMQWVGLFLFGRGLATFVGRHVNLSLLFPMEEVFEDFVTHSFRRYQNSYGVIPQGPRKHLASIAGEKVFFTKPDISLTGPDGVRFILDAKWKRVNMDSGDLKHGVSQSDIYQLYAYGKLHNCRTVALVYPKNRTFTAPLRYRYFDGLKLVCIPFDVTRPEPSVRETLSELERASKE